VADYRNDPRYLDAVEDANDALCEAVGQGRAKLSYDATDTAVSPRRRQEQQRVKQSQDEAAAAAGFSYTHAELRDRGLNNLAIRNFVRLGKLRTLRIGKHLRYFDADVAKLAG
jgi:hypothetical protein